MWIAILSPFKDIKLLVNILVIKCKALSSSLSSFFEPELDIEKGYQQRKSDPRAHKKQVHHDTRQWKAFPSIHRFTSPLIHQGGVLSQIPSFLAFPKAMVWPVSSKRSIPRSQFVWFRLVRLPGYKARCLAVYLSNLFLLTVPSPCSGGGLRLLIPKVWNRVGFFL